MCSCVLNTVYHKRNTAAHGAHKTSQREKKEERTSEGAHSQTSICTELKTNQSPTALRETEELDSVCVHLCDPSGGISEGGNNKSSNCSPTLEWAKLKVARTEAVC